MFQVKERADSLRGDQIAREPVILYRLQGMGLTLKFHLRFVNFHKSSSCMRAVRSFLKVTVKVRKDLKVKVNVM